METPNSLNNVLEMEYRKDSGTFVKKLASWISLDFSLKILGFEIISWHYPPIADRKEV